LDVKIRRCAGWWTALIAIDLKSLGVAAGKGQRIFFNLERQALIPQALKLRQRLSIVRAPKMVQQENRRITCEWRRGRPL